MDLDELALRVHGAYISEPSSKYNSCDEGMSDFDDDYLCNQPSPELLEDSLIVVCEPFKVVSPKKKLKSSKPPALKVSKVVVNRVKKNLAKKAMTVEKFIEPDDSLIVPKESKKPDDFKFNNSFLKPALEIPSDVPNKQTKAETKQKSLGGYNIRNHSDFPELPGSASSNTTLEKIYDDYSDSRITSVGTKTKATSFLQFMNSNSYETSTSDLSKSDYYSASVPLEKHVQSVASNNAYYGNNTNTLEVQKKELENKSVTSILSRRQKRDRERAKLWREHLKYKELLPQNNQNCKLDCNINSTVKHSKRTTDANKNTKNNRLQVSIGCGKLVDSLKDSVQTQIKCNTKKQSRSSTMLNGANLSTKDDKMQQVFPLRTQINISKPSETRCQEAFISNQSKKSVTLKENDINLTCANFSYPYTSLSNNAVTNNRSDNNLNSKNIQLQAPALKKQKSVKINTTDVNVSNNSCRFISTSAQHPKSILKMIKPTKRRKEKYSVAVQTDRIKLRSLQTQTLETKNAKIDNNYKELKSVESQTDNKGLRSTPSTPSMFAPIRVLGFISVTFLLTAFIVRRFHAIRSII